LTVYVPTRGVSLVPTWAVRNSMLAQSPTGYQVSPTSDSAPTTTGLAAITTSTAGTSQVGARERFPPSPVSRLPPTSSPARTRTDIAAAHPIDDVERRSVGRRFPHRS
jgi:hypothetical protein